jgi:hypothetical protein
MNPPPMITLGIENTTIIMPQVFLFAGLFCNIKAPSNTITPTINPTVASPINNIGSFPLEPGSVGMIPINHCATTPRSTALIRIRIPDVRANLKALVGFLDNVPALFNSNKPQLSANMLAFILKSFRSWLFQKYISDFLYLIIQKKAYRKRAKTKPLSIAMELLDFPAGNS